MKSIFEKIIPFLFLGMFIVILALGIILISNLMILGAIVGFVLYLIAVIKEKFFPSKNLTKPNPRGRTFDHDDKR